MLFIENSSNSVNTFLSQCKDSVYNIPMSFGKWLRDRRESLGLSQGELSERSGLSVSYISALERDEPNTRDGRPRQPKLDKVDRLARSLEIGTNEARSAAGYAPKTETPTFELTASARIALLDQNLTPEEQAEIVEEMAIAYEIVMARRKAKKERAEQ